ncbi:MAG: hypothetical protein ACLUV8_15335 [Clostridium sp.]
MIGLTPIILASSSESVNSHGNAIGTWQKGSCVIQCHDAVFDPRTQPVPDPGSDGRCHYSTVDDERKKNSSNVSKRAWKMPYHFQTVLLITLGNQLYSVRSSLAEEEISLYDLPHHVTSH